MRILLFVIAFAAAASPQTPGSIEGKVVDAVTSAPLRKASVLINRFGAGEPLALTTDAHGAFTASSLDPGKFRIQTDRAGYLTTFNRMPLVVDVNAGETTRAIVKLQPQSVITGRVIDADGDPIPNATVELVWRTWTGGRQVWRPIRGVQTNDMGEYRMPGLPAGKHILRANVRGGSMFQRAFRGTASAGYAEAYYPGVSDPSSASAVEIATGVTTSGVDFRLRLERVYRISGRVNNLAAPGKSVSVGAWQPGRDGMFITIGADGVFELDGYPPGSYLVLAECISGKTQHRARVPVQIAGGDVEGVEITLLSAVEVKGRVRAASGEEMRFEGQIQVMDTTIPDMTWSADVRPDGTLAFDELPPGEYRISGSSWPKGFYLKSARAGQADILSSGLRVPSGELELILAETRAVIEGTVTKPDGSASGAGVALLPDDPLSVYQRRFTTAREDGSFQIDSIAPGGYHLVAVERMNYGAFDDPDYLLALRSRMVPLTIKGESQETIDLRVVSTAELPIQP